MTGFSPDEEESSAINKLAKSLYNLVSKKKNRNKGQEWILEEEKDFLYSTVQYSTERYSVQENLGIRSSPSLWINCPSGKKTNCDY